MSVLSPKRQPKTGQKWFRLRGAGPLLYGSEDGCLEKLYYAIRNRVFLEMNSFRWKGSLLYHCNMASYLTLFFI